MKRLKNPVILYVGTFPPRECGIATFTQDLTNAFDKEFNPGLQSKILVINDNGTSIYNYPKKVVWQINETDIEDYMNQANLINKSSQIKLVNIQHEYGIFGGEWGSYLLPFLALVKKPVITTFHTVLPKPKEELKKVTASIANKSSAVVVMTKSAEQILTVEYGVKKSKIRVIPHGVHHLPFPSKERAKKNLKLTGKIILSSFGMLNRDKGIEYAIAALPAIVKLYPNLLYLVIGATHPLVRRQEGEVYRNKLKKLVFDLGLKDYVKFYNKYLNLDELIEYLKATDIYLSPTLNPQQSVSGTVSYALSCACPIISTATQYAQDVINMERGRLVRFKNSGDIKNALSELLSDGAKTKEMGKNAYFFSRHMTWQNVALSYFKVFNSITKIEPREKGKLPSINLDYLKKLTDNFGMIQFAKHTKPDIYSGYCLDDNARALLAGVIYYQLKPSTDLLNLIKIYLAFVKYAQKTNGKFYNFIGYNKNLNNQAESEDSFGRVIWALSYLIISSNLPIDLQQKAKKILNKALKQITEIQSLRALAFSLLGLTCLAGQTADNQITGLVKRLADKLARRYWRQIDQTKTKNWLWFENCLTYSNYKLPEALMRAYKIIKNKDYLKIAESTLNFLNNVSFEKKDYFSAIGQDGWYFHDGKRAYFDQQPEDTASAVEALVTAYEITKKKTYANLAKLAYEWFLGRNHLNQMVYDEATGGCYDGLGKNSLNFNQGAESTISYLLARLAMEKVKFD